MTPSQSQTGPQGWVQGVLLTLTKLPLVKMLLLLAMLALCLALLLLPLSERLLLCYCQ